MMVHQPAPKFMLRQLQMLTAEPSLRSRRAHKIRGNITVVMLCTTSRRSQTSRARASSASLLVFPMRACGIRPQVKPETSRFPRKELPHMPGSKTTPDWASARVDALSMLPSVKMNTSTSGTIKFSRLDDWPMRSPVNASPASSRTPTRKLGVSAVR